MDTNANESDVTLARAAFAEALRVQMARAGVNKRDLARLTRRGGAVGISEGTIGKYWRGEQTPRPPEQFQIEKALGIELGDLNVNAVAVYKRLQAEGATPETVHDLA